MRQVLVFGLLVFQNVTQAHIFLVGKAKSHHVRAGEIILVCEALSPLRTVCIERDVLENTLIHCRFYR